VRTPAKSPKKLVGPARQVWRLGFTVEVDAANEREATEMAKTLYEQWAPTVKAMNGGKWLLPVADVRKRERPIA
jgi:hypothetical protein